MPCCTYLTHWINNGLVRLTIKPCIKCDITGVAAIVYVCLIIPSKTEHHVAFKSSFTKKCWPSVSISLTCLSIHIRKIEIWGFSTIFNYIGYSYIFGLISPSDICSIIRMTVILVCRSLWHQTHFDATTNNNNGSFKCLDIHYH